MSRNRPKQDVEKALSQKGFTLRSTDHNYFIYYTQEGKKTAIKTKTSFGRKPKNLVRDLLSAMARQCKLTNDQFLALVDCPLSRKSYERILEENGHL